MKPLLIAFFTVALMHTTVIAKEKTPGLTPQQKQEELKKQKEQDKVAREKRREAVQAVLEAKDRNHDSSLSLEEYVAGEADAAAAAKAFDKFNKNKDRSLSKAEIAALLGL